MRQRVIYSVGLWLSVGVGLSAPVMAQDGPPGDGIERNYWPTDEWRMSSPEDQLMMARDPGTDFNYCNGVSHLLSAIVHQATGQTALELARNELFPVWGIGRVTWEHDPDGNPAGGWGLYMTPRDMARLGVSISEPGLLGRAADRVAGVGGGVDYGAHQRWLRGIWLPVVCGVGDRLSCDWIRRAIYHRAPGLRSRGGDYQRSATREL